MSELAHKPMPVALLYGDAESSKTLRAALDEIGAELVCDTGIEDFSLDRLGSSGANVVLISLDAEIEDHLDDIYDALDEDRYRVMFDDPEISNHLDGWERARWQRHLEAKLRNDTNWDPPRPEDIPPVEVPPQPESSEPAAVLPRADDLPVLPGDPIPNGDKPIALDDGVEIPADPPASGAELGVPTNIELELEAAISELESTTPPAPDSAPEVADTIEMSLGAELDSGQGGDGPADTSTEDDLASAGGAGGLDFDADLAAELDALASADDPLAALAALAKQDQETAAPNAGTPAIDNLSVAGLDAGAKDDGEVRQSIAPEEGVDMPGGDEDSTDWDALEAELNAAFDSETLAALDQMDVEDTGKGENPAWENAPVSSPVAEASDDGTPPAAPLDATADAPGTGDISNFGTPAGPAQGEEVPALDGADLPDQSEWALIDYDDVAPAVDDVSGQAEDETPDEGEGTDEAEEEETFHLELVDPVEYLKPEEPKNISNELFKMPSLMSMAEAVAPKVGEVEEDDEPAKVVVRNIVVLGASIGGPDAVRDFLSCLPQKLPACVVLVQHLGSEFIDLMVGQLAKSSALPVRIPGRVERAVHSEVLVVPSGNYLKVAPDGQVVLAEPEGDEPGNPSISHTMSLAAGSFGERATAIIFSGMAGGAVAGAQEIAARGGEVWVQDPASCVVSKMVEEVIEAGVATATGTPAELAERLVQHLQEIDNDPSP